LQENSGSFDKSSQPGKSKAPLLRRRGIGEFEGVLRELG